MQIILLSGGSGKRLWPLSGGPRSKQFLRLLPAPDGGVESMVQRVVRQLREAGLGENLTFATGESQKDVLVRELGEDLSVVTEPERRDTFPAIVLSAAHLHFERGCSEDEVVVVMPCDPFTEAGYFETLRKLVAAVQDGAGDLVLMGIRPTAPSEKFGYIVPAGGSAAGSMAESSALTGSASPALKVSHFVEKPSADVAAKLISEGALWNGGVFAFRLGYILSILRKYVDASSFSELRSRYGELPMNSFDYEVVEKAESVAVVPFNGVWKDLGTWDALTAELPGDHIGNAVLGGGTENSFVINELDVPVMAIGAKGLVVVASPEGILVCDKDECAGIKTYAERLSDRE
ncbi:MAG: NTP transferase domain-containing protein [Bacteroidales bacterium]|nr:NTP transferase domain-containing protein [Bacteroidales bacterium]